MDAHRYFIERRAWTKRWTLELSNEWGRLGQRNTAGDESTDTVDFIPYNEEPQEKKFTYASFVYDHCPLKDEIWRILHVVGGDELEYKFDSCSLATNLLETKILFISVISDVKRGTFFKYGYKKNVSVYSNDIT